MLDASYYQKTDEIIAMHTREERSLIPIIQDIQGDYRGKSVQCGKLL